MLGSSALLALLLACLCGVAGGARSSAGLDDEGQIRPRPGSRVRVNRGPPPSAWLPRACAWLGCNAPMAKGASCQCRETCEAYGDCCDDYKAFCRAGSPAPRSCASLGCNASMEKGASCQCNTKCEQFGDCCDDYQPVCQAGLPAPRSCASLGCNAPPEKGASCQCNKKCEKFGDCCDDYQPVCRAGSPAPSPAPRSCASLGCDAPPEKGASCQCNKKCEKFGDCCGDYQPVCRAGSPPAAQTGNTRHPPARGGGAKACPTARPGPNSMVPYVAQSAACLQDLPFTNLGAQGVPPPTTADLARVNSSLAIYVHDIKFKRVAATNERIGLCLSIFPGSVPMVWPAAVPTESKPVCVLAATVRRGVQPVFWSDYNPRRGIPNFVAYVNRGWKKQRGSCKRKWVRLPSFGEKKYGPGDVAPKPGSHCSVDPDCACSERVSSRGHMATLSQHMWDLNAAMATNTYVNTVPARQPFDGGQWNARERENRAYAVRKGPVFVVKGPSLEFDGVTKHGVQVPTMFWATLYDPRENKGTAWTFRNGYSQPQGFNSSNGLPEVGCFGADNLAIHDVERAVGLKFFPGALRHVGQLRSW